MPPLTDPVDHLIETVDDGVATLTMNRPEARNALSAAMSADLEEAIPRLAEDSDIRVVVLTGTGGAFCAGGDVKGFARSDSRRRGGGVGAGPSFEQRVAGLRAATEIVRCLHEMPKPTLAAIPGPAAGGGLSLALACDIRIAAASAKFTTAFAKLGLSGDYGGSFFLPRLVGAAKARELYFTAELVDAPGGRADWLGEPRLCGCRFRSGGQCLEGAPSRLADDRPRLHEAKPQRRRGRFAWRCARYRSRAHDDDLRHRGPPPRRAGVRRQTPTQLPGSLSSDRTRLSPQQLDRLRALLEDLYATMKTQRPRDLLRFPRRGCAHAAAQYAVSMRSALTGSYHQPSGNGDRYVASASRCGLPNLSQ